MNAFIIRPFGVKSYVDPATKQKVDVDFDKVQNDLIDPALTAIGVFGRTTGEVVVAGNIRDDMFEMLLTRDLVVADLSIHNANVFYELGIRHALRDKWTFLIRGDGYPTPFDNLTDRYFVYNRANPASSLPGLIDALSQTRDSLKKDSPVFHSLPELEAQDPARFVVVPQDFGEDVERAKLGGYPGDLQLLASETGGFSWQVEGLRYVGRAQFKADAMVGARQTWEAVRDTYPNDLEANERLGTIYQRLGDLTRSNQALDRVLQHKGLEQSKLAEIHSLVARNHKANWLADWKDLVDGRREAALRSPDLKNAFNSYDKGFSVDRNHYYSGLNAAAMLTVRASLADAFPEVWAEPFGPDEDPDAELTKMKLRLAKLLVGVELSLEAERQRLERVGQRDIWFELSQADHALLSIPKPSYVASRYRSALVNAEGFYRNSVAAQLDIYARLQVLDANVKTALAEVTRKPPVIGSAAVRTVVFTGHRVDSPGRANPRFPADKEAVARQAIEAAVRQELSTPGGGSVVGIAGGASGGDILFHEVCDALKVPTTLFLPFSRDEFVRESVQDAGAGWVTRFNAIYDRLDALKAVRILQDSKALPVWLRRRAGYTVWDRSNLWILENALVGGGSSATLVALWDGKEGDGPGGTRHMVEQARKRGAKTIPLDTIALFGTGPAVSGTTHVV